jgi:hypothetical protein
MADFKIGELINVTMRGLRIESIDDVGIAQCSLPGEAWRPTVNLRAEVDIERVAPEQWPPRHGDLWCDASGRLWAGMQVTTEDDDTVDEPYVVLIAVDAAKRSRSFDQREVLENYGPVSLQYRRPSDSDGA